MKILWICNIMPPVIGKALGIETSIKEGWISGILEQMTEAEEEIELSICYPIAKEAHRNNFSLEITSELSGKTKKIECYEFYEDQVRPEVYGGTGLEKRMEEIFQKVRPDLLHLFGTEYGHSLAAVRAFRKKDKILVGIQGVVAECALEYMAGLSDKIQKRKSFRDILKQDSMKQQQKKFFLRAKREEEILKLSGCATGRTEFDYRAVKKRNPDIKYYAMNETMRTEFYQGEWRSSDCVKYRIFFSQADYPLKGFHHMLQAAGILKKKYPSLTIHVAGNSIFSYKTIKEKIKISAYGTYLRKLIQDYGLEGMVEIKGKLLAEEMKQEYLSAHCFVCASSVENSPNSVAEAMLLGTPVIASDTGGIPSMIRDGIEGLLFTKNDSQALADCIDKVWSNDTLANTLSKKGRETSFVRHDPGKNYRRLMEIYDEIVNRKEIHDK